MLLRAFIKGNYTDDICWKVNENSLNFGKTTIEEIIHESEEMNYKYEERYSRVCSSHNEGQSYVDENSEIKVLVNETSLSDYEIQPNLGRFIASDAIAGYSNIIAWRIGVNTKFKDIINHPGRTKLHSCAYLTSSETKSKEDHNLFIYCYSLPMQIDTAIALQRLRIDALQRIRHEMDVLHHSLPVLEVYRLFASCWEPLCSDDTWGQITSHPRFLKDICIGTSAFPMNFIAACFQLIKGLENIKHLIWKVSYEILKSNSNIFMNTSNCLKLLRVFVKHDDSSQQVLDEFASFANHNLLPRTSYVDSTDQTYSSQKLPCSKYAKPSKTSRVTFYDTLIESISTTPESYACDYTPQRPKPASTQLNKVRSGLKFVGHGFVPPDAPSKFRALLFKVSSLLADDHSALRYERSWVITDWDSSLHFKKFSEILSDVELCPIPKVMSFPSLFEIFTNTRCSLSEKLNLQTRTCSLQMFAWDYIPLSNYTDFVWATAHSKPDYTSSVSNCQQPDLVNTLITLTQTNQLIKRSLLYFYVFQSICFTLPVLVAYCLILTHCGTDLMRLAAHLCHRILLSGDVEVNPGPINSTDRADFGDLVTIPEVDPAWERLGVVLKLDRGVLQNIKAKHKSQTRCKREMFRLAVNKGVTWKEVLKGLCEIGMNSLVRTVCSMYEIPLNGLSSLVLSERQSEDSVEVDVATPTNKEAKSISSSIEFQTFQTTRGFLEAEAASDPILLANAVFSRGIISQDSLHELRIISEDQKKAVKLVSLIEDTLRDHPYKFESLTSSLRSISSHVSLADKVSNLYRFNRIARKMKDYSPGNLDMNHLSAEFNNSRLISDDARLKAASATNFVEMCSVFLAELQEKELSEQYLILLDSFPNTKSVGATLRELQQKRHQPHPQTLERRPQGYSYSATTDVARSASSTEIDAAGVALRSSRIMSPDTDSDPYLSADSDIPSVSHKVSDDKFRAALEGWDVKLVESMLTSGAAKVEHLFEDQQTALMLAAIEGHKDMIRMLLRHRASVVARDDEGCTALYLAASNGNYEAVKILAGQPLADVNIVNKHGEPLLMKPAKKGFSMVTELLVQYGAKVNVETKDGESPLYVAIRKGNFDVVKVLLENNAEFTKQCRKTLRTPLEEALLGDDPEIVRLLMKAVSRVNEKSQKLFSCKTRDEVKHLVSKGAKVDTRDSTEATPLLVHTRDNCIEVVKELILQKANVDLQDCDGFTPLTEAAKTGKLELVQLLVKHGAILDLKEKAIGYTPMMFAIQNGHVRVVKDLVLARANATIRNRDGKSCLDLAREKGNREILEALNVQPTTSTANDPFISILSGYMAEKGRLRIRGKHSPGTGSPSLQRSKAVVPLKAPYVPEEDSAQMLEVKKYQRRIADLETRIHDLTILGTMEVADESDLTYMERGRLESEFRKLKESKKKAEQYAVEAKQTAQRLSAENFKLREDLSKERHYNELTRKNMMREVEVNVERAAGHEKTAAIRSEVFNEEVANRAFLGRESSSLFQKVKFTGEQIKQLIVNETVSVNSFHVVVAGLPFSGKTSLVKSLFDCPKAVTTPAVDLYEAIIHRSKLPEQEVWFEGSKLQSEVHTMMVGFANFFAREHKLPNLELKDMAGMFDDPEVQQNFETTCSALREIVLNIDDETKIERMLVGSLSLLNVYDVGVNRAVYEFMMAVEGRNKNLLLVNVLDLNHSDNAVMVRPVNLADARYQEANYSKNQVNIFKSHNALHFFVRNMQAASLSESTDTTPNTLIVGTHADKFTSPTDCLDRENKIMDLLKYCSSDMGYRSDAYFPAMVSVDARNEKSCEMVKTALLKLIDNNKDFKIDMPLKFMFLRYVLYSTKRVYMSRKEVIEYAKKCYVEASEVEKFFEIFRNAASIISSEKPSEFLHDYVILLPVVFLRDLDKFYCIQDDITIPIELRETAQYGILSDRALKSLWQGADRSNMPTWEFYVKVLENVLLLMEIENGKYFCPSLRVQYSESPINAKSLFISTSFASSGGKKLAFVKYLTEHHKDELKLSEECPDCNSIEFNSTSVTSSLTSSLRGIENGKVTIRFFHNFIEIFVHPGISSSYADNLYSMLKTDSVAIMNDIGELNYEFSVLCPKSNKKPFERLHFVPFDILDDSKQRLHCSECKQDVNTLEGSHWVQAAYQGPRRAALQANDIINPSNLLSICKELSLKIQDIDTLAKKLLEKDFAPMGQVPVEEVLFNVLYSWHCCNPTATKRRLAQSLLECGFTKQAIQLNPKLLNRTKLLSETCFSKKEITLIASSWADNWEPEELAKVLEVTSMPTGGNDIEKCSSLIEDWLERQDGDRREKLASKFQEEEYPSMADYIISEL